MSFRISPVWWPLLVGVSPVLFFSLGRKYKIYMANQQKADQLNQDQMQHVDNLEMPEIESMEIHVLVEEKTQPGFLGDAGVAYVLKTDQGAVLFDIGFGRERKSFGHNARKLNFDLRQVNGLVISHLHPDHMGGLKACRHKSVIVPIDIGLPGQLPCYLPDKAQAPGFLPIVVDKPQQLAAGLVSTGPLYRSLFFFGLTSEQSIIAKIKGKGIVILTGCGHPTLEVILKMVANITSDPIYAICGGLHLPVTAGRGNALGLQFQTFIGTGKPPWQRIEEQELSDTIALINQINPKKVLLSGHDSCDHALSRMQQEIDSEVAVLEAGAKYSL